MKLALHLNKVQEFVSENNYDVGFYLTQSIHVYLVLCKQEIWIDKTKFFLYKLMETNYIDKS